MPADSLNNHEQNTKSMDAFLFQSHTDRFVIAPDLNQSHRLLHKSQLNSNRFYSCTITSNSTYKMIHLLGQGEVFFSAAIFMLHIRLNPSSMIYGNGFVFQIGVDEGQKVNHEHLSVWNLSNLSKEDSKLNKAFEILQIVEVKMNGKKNTSHTLLHILSR